MGMNELHVAIWTLAVFLLGYYLGLKLSPQKTTEVRVFSVFTNQKSADAKTTELIMSNDEPVDKETP